MGTLRLFENPEFGKIRTIEENGKVLFCAKDVAKSLAYKDTDDAIRRHCRYPVKRRVPHPQNPDKQIEMTFIPEGDVYRLMARSELPGADKFESWIFDDVVPSIRKHGMYATENTVEAMLNDPDTAIRLLTEIKEERTKRKALEAENEAQKQMIADFQPIKQYVDNILSSTRTLTTTQIAADYDMSAKQLNKILHEEGIQRYVNGQWILYKEHMGKGYTKSKTINITRSDGRPDTVLNTEWTQKGRLMIHEILTKRGILAVMDREQAS